MNEKSFQQRVQLDPEFFGIPLDGTDRSSVRLVLILRKEADPADGPFCRLRQLSDANIYLGCFIDRSGHVLKWLELWVRDYDNIAESFHENAFDIINNEVLDERWERQRKTLAESVASHFYATTLDVDADCPLYIDYFNKLAVLPSDEASKTHWKICREDNLLRRLGLAPYRTTFHRYLYLESLGANSFFLPITPNAPIGERTRDIDEMVSVRSTLLPFNRYGGPIFVREIAPMSIAGYLTVVSGKRWQGAGQGQRGIFPTGVYREVSSEVTVGYGSGRLLPSRAGSRIWNLESLYLKTRLFYEMITLVKRCIELDRKPFFSLDTSSFAVNLPNTAASSPFLWDAEVALNQSSDAIGFSVEQHSELDSKETAYFRTFRSLAASIYRPEALGQERSIYGEVTIIDIKKDRESGLYRIMGTLRSPDLSDIAFSGTRQLYFIDYPVRGRRLRLVSEMVGSDAHNPDKISLCSRKVALNSEQVLALESFRGVELSGIYCEVLPTLGTPCDLYSLGVIGLEIIFHGSGSPLPLLKDKLRSLALACMELDPSEPIEKRAARVLAEDAELSSILLPSALGVAREGPAQMRLPAEDRLWESLLVVLMRLQTGLLRDEGYVTTLSNENSFRISQIFEQPVKDLSRLLAVFRALCTGDVHSSDFIRGVVDSLLIEIGENNNE
jgi:hypothetical protein